MNNTTRMPMVMAYRRRNDGTESIDIGGLSRPAWPALILTNRRVDNTILTTPGTTAIRGKSEIQIMKLDSKYRFHLTFGWRPEPAIVRWNVLLTSELSKQRRPFPARLKTRPIQRLMCFFCCAEINSISASQASEGKCFYGSTSLIPQSCTHSFQATKIAASAILSATLAIVRVLR